MNISQPFIRRPIATTMLMIGITLLGAAAYEQLPVASLPSVDSPTIQVIALYPGSRRRSANHGFVGCDAVGASIWRDRGTDTNDLEQRRR
jgi:hypothetical protein